MDTKTIPTQDERILAALSHIAVLLPMWGLIMSGLIWATQREKSAYVRRQGVQALAWQISLLAGLFVGMGCYFASFFSVFFTAFAAETMDSPPLFFPVFPLLSFGLIFLIGIVFIIFGIVAAVRTLQGNEYVYPFIGDRVQAYLHASKEE